MLSKQSFFRTSIALLGFAALGAMAPASARVTCCDVDGRRTCGDPPPMQCLNKSKKVFSKGGVAQDVEAPLTAEQKAARDAELLRKAEEEKKAADQERRDRALMASFTSEKEIDQALNRAVADIERNSEQAQNRLEAALKKQKALAQEQEFYRKKPLPAALQSQIKDNESEIAAQQKALKEKDVTLAEVKARFEANKTRYRQLSGKGGGK